MKPTDEELDEILVEMAKRGEYATRECLREVYRLMDSGEFEGLLSEAAEHLGYRKCVE